MVNTKMPFVESSLLFRQTDSEVKTVHDVASRVAAGRGLEQRSELELAPGLN
jgi:hypothetical protein